MTYVRACILAVALLAAIPARASLIVNAIFDGSITADSHAAQIESSIDSAVSTYEQLFANNITVSLYFQEFNGNSGLGQSDVGFVYLEPYQSFYDQLVATDANPTAIATLQAGGGNGNTNGGKDPVLGAPYIELKSANARALGFGAAGLCYVTAGDTSPGSDVPNHCGSSGSTLVDGIISLNAYITSPPQGLNGNYSLISVVEHEIDEVMGLGSALPNTVAGSGTVTSPYVAPEDLWRYNSTGTARVFSVNCAGPGTAWFSVTGSGGGQRFNNACNGGDFGDWASGATPQVQDAFSTPGADPTLGANEIAALTAVGYQLGSPEPGTFALLLSALAGIAIARGRSRR